MTTRSVPALNRMALKVFCCEPVAIMRCTVIWSVPYSCMSCRKKEMATMGSDRLKREGGQSRMSSRPVEAA